MYTSEPQRDPRPSGCKKLVGEEDAWRIRIGDYRALYEILEDVLVVTVVHVAHRRDVCKKTFGPRR
ncbi:mRNA-degrading endonuclease RelE of RelBE toxin-antitoxin system [Conyzicola nivalis]|uniref:mRNA-degrading endonuclease RelE of RelBE toxin-antitoxin system n=1 Tax=Conyzicola nivalis TaxID=1477021 RepID=A0ABV2QKV0_9MICO